MGIRPILRTMEQLHAMTTDDARNDFMLNPASCGASVGVRGHNPGAIRLMLTKSIDITLFYLKNSSNFSTGQQFIISSFSAQPRRAWEIPYSM